MATWKVALSDVTIGEEEVAAGREKALREYSSEKYYERLMAMYHRAIELEPGGPK